MERRFVFFYAVLAAFALSFAWPAGVSGQRSDQSIQDWQKETLRPPQGGKLEPGTFEEPAVTRGETKEGFTEAAWNTYRDLDKKIHSLGRKIDSKGDEIKEDARNAWEDVKVKQKAARTQLDVLSSTAKEAWEKARAETNAALDSLRQSYNKALSYFR